MFELITLDAVLKKTPKDHKQTEHHKLSFYVLFIITKGQGIHVINYKEYPFKKGTVFCLRKGVTHKFIKNNAEGTLLVFTEDFIVKYLGKTEGLKSLHLFNELVESPKIQLKESLFIEVKTILSQLIVESKSTNDNFTASIKRNLLQVLISKFYREKSKNNKLSTNSKYLNQFIQFQNLVEAQWHENKTALHYAKQMAITPKTLNKVVNSIVKKTAKSLIDEIVTTQIKHLLVNTELSITEIAYQSGFDDSTNFFKYFKKNTSFSPLQFRNTNK